MDFFWLIKTKHYSNSYKNYKNTNLATNQNGVPFWSWFWCLVLALWRCLTYWKSSRIKAVEHDEMNYPDLQRNWEIVFFVLFFEIFFMSCFKSSHLRCIKKAVLKNFAVFTGKPLQSLFSKVAVLLACNLIEKRLQQ